MFIAHPAIEFPIPAVAGVNGRITPRDGATTYLHFYTDAGQLVPVPDAVTLWDLTRGPTGVIIPKNSVSFIMTLTNSYELRKGREVVASFNAGWRVTGGEGYPVPVTRLNP